MTERGDGGSIVNILSYSGMNGLGSSLAYAASKGALDTLTKGLAHTLAPPLRESVARRRVLNQPLSDAACASSLRSSCAGGLGGGSPVSASQRAMMFSMVSP